jgi:hypothetical protein
MRALLHAFTLAAATALATTGASAQIVNVQPLIGNGLDEGFSAAIEASADIRRGNANVVALSGGGIAQYRSGRHLGFILLKGDFGEAEGVSFMNKDLEHLRYRIDIVGPLAGEVFVQHDRDEFRRLSLRAIAGGGPRIHVVQWGLLDAALGVAYMLEHERLAEDDESDASSSTIAHRLSTYVVLATRVGDVMTLGVTMYAQPRLDHFSDVRILCETSLLAKTSKRFGLKLALTSAYDSDPPVDVAHLDSTLKGSLQVNF